MTSQTQNTDYWKEFWNNKDDPLHRASTDEHFDKIAEELRLLVPDNNGLDVLELGCGNGVLYERLGFENSSYVGVDLSDAMIKKFKGDFPGTDLHVGSATDFKLDRKFDLIFTNGVMQYLDHDDLAVHFKLASAMLKPNGRLIHASVPWKDLRRTYLAGQFREVVPENQARQMAVTAAYMSGLKKDNMGTWYSLPTVRSIAGAHNLDATFYGSLYYPYRFHTCLTLNTGA